MESPSRFRWYEWLFLPLCEQAATLYGIVALPGLLALALTHWFDARWLKIVFAVCFTPFALWMTIMFGIMLPVVLVWQAFERLRGPK